MISGTLESSSLMAMFCMFRSCHTVNGGSLFHKVMFCFVYPVCFVARQAVYPSFLRVAGPYKHFAPALSELCRHHGWSGAHILYASGPSRGQTFATLAKEVRGVSFLVIKLCREFFLWSDQGTVAVVEFFFFFSK